MLIRVKVFAGEKKNEILKKGGNSFEIKTKEKAENNKANKAVVSILADYFKLPCSCFWLIKGRKERNKIFEIKCKTLNNYEK